MQETQVWSLCLEDPLEKRMAMHSNIFAWRISWTEEPGGLLYMGSQKVGHNWATNTRVMQSEFKRTHQGLLSMRYTFIWASQLVQWKRISLPMQETQLPSLAQEDPLEKEMTTHSSIFVWEIQWTEEPGEPPWGRRRVGHDLVTKQQQQNFLYTHFNLKQTTI